MLRKNISQSALSIKTAFLWGTIALVALAFLVPLGWAGEKTAPIAWWTFDEVTEGGIMDKISDFSDPLTGNFRPVKGVAGKAVKFDGYTTMVKRGADKALALPSAFTLEAWIAPAAYPWTWCPIIDHSGENAGYAFEIGPSGEVALKVFSGSLWRTCVSRINLPIRSWSHVAGVYDPDYGLRVFIDGKEQGRLEFQGQMTAPRRTDLVIGSVREPKEPSYIHREHGTLPGWFSLDAILDELKIYDRAMSDEDVAGAWAVLKTIETPEISERVLPSGPPGPGRFGAYYTHLKYYWEWDDLWRIAEHPDVVVQFDNSPVRVVFWRGTRFSPAWVTENNLWMADQSIETWNDEEGCFEHMQDRHCRYSHVRIIENTPARVVVHWRYAPTSAYDNHWNVDPRTGWGCWVDEYYYFYPDQTGIRKYTWQTGSLGRPRQFQESIPLTGPGQTQGDVVNEQYVTVANLEGKKQQFFYVENPSRQPDREIPEKPMIQQHNLKSDNKPFIIFEPGGEMRHLRDMNISSLVYSGSCSHWPIGQMCCDGRTQRTTDRAASFLGFPITSPVVHDDGPRSWVSSLYGMNDRPFDELIALARSWIHAPELIVISGTVESPDYDFSQRAYTLVCTDSEMPSADLSLKATPDSPAGNVCVKIIGWGSTVPAVKVNGKNLKAGADFEFGQVHTLEGADLVLWLELDSTQSVKIVLGRSS